MDTELTKEFKKIDQRFEKMDQRFEKIDQRFEKMDQRFEKLMGFLREQMATKNDIATLRAELADKADIDRVYTAVDVVAKDYIQYSQELIALKHRFDQMDEFNKQVAAKLGLNYEA